MEDRRKLEMALAAMGTTGAQKDEAYGILYENGRAVLFEYLRSRGVREEDTEEVVQNVFVRILESWDRLKFDGHKQWYGYLYKAARNGAMDQPPAPRVAPQVESPDPTVDVAADIEDAVERGGLHRLADEAWLGPEPEDSSAKRLLAMLLYVDGKPVDDVLALARATSASVVPKSGDALQDWLSETWVLRKIAFDALYWSNDRLVARLLGLPESYPASRLDELCRQAIRDEPNGPALGEWHWGDIQVIVSRYRYGMPASQLMRKFHAHAEENISSILARCEAAFPFVEIMTGIWSRLDGHPLRERALRDNPLWKRLVFHYHAVHELQQFDILQRVSQPAEVAGYSLKHVNTWIAGRLVEELKKHLAKSDATVRSGEAV